MNGYYHNITIGDLWNWANQYCCVPYDENCWYECCDYQPLTCQNHPSCQVDFSGPGGWEYLAKNLSAVVKEVLHKPA